jgi:hypothetical protein
MDSEFAGHSPRLGMTSGYIPPRTAGVFPRLRLR